MRKEAIIHISKNSNIKVVRKGPHVTIIQEPGTNIQHGPTVTKKRKKIN